MDENQGNIRLIPFECDTIAEYLTEICLQFDNLTPVGKEATLYLVSKILNKVGPVKFEGSLWYDKADTFETVFLDPVLDQSFPAAEDVEFPHDYQNELVEQYFEKEKRDRQFESPN